MSKGSKEKANKAAAPKGPQRDVDEACDPENPKILQIRDVELAAKSLGNHIKPTPCRPAHTQQEFGINLYYKLEFLLPSGCFKERGALCPVLKIPPAKRRFGVMIAGTGNEAIGLCYHTKRLKISATVVVPHSLPLHKINKIRSLGGKTVLHGNTFSEAVTHARVYAKQRGATYINVRDHPQSLGGFGTVGLEILNQLPCVDAILVPLGTGALAGAIATVVKAKKPSCLVYGIESENLGLVTKSLAMGEPACNPEGVVDSLAGNALSVNMVGVNTFVTVKSYLDRVLRVKEDWIARAMLHLAEREKFIVEGPAACPLAAILGYLVPELKTKNVVIVLTGGNINSLLLNRCLQRGLAVEGRLVSFKVGVYNTPGAKSELMTLLANRGYNVITHFVDNCWTEGGIFRIEIKVVVETRNLEHAFDLKRIIERAYPETAAFENDLLDNKRRCLRCHTRYIKEPSIHSSEASETS